MTILALEFSSTRRSAAVVASSGMSGEVTETGFSGATNLALVTRALGEARIEREQIDAVAVGIGPGSYNGIRASIALAQGWQLARNVQLAGVGSAESVAEAARVDGLRGLVNVVIDAQRNEFYLARFEIDADQFHEIEPLRLATPDEVRESERSGGLLIGPEVTRWFPNGREIFPRASLTAVLALRREQFVSGEKLEPIYLRTPQFVKAPPPRVFPES